MSNTLGEARANDRTGSKLGESRHEIHLTLNFVQLNLNSQRTFGHGDDTHFP